MSLEISEETTFLLDMVNVPYGPELHTLSNAIADPNGTEADATTGFTQVGLDVGSNIFASQGGAVNVGSYAFQADSNDTPTPDARFYVDLEAAPFNFVNGERGKIEFDIRHVGSGDIWRFGMGTTNNDNNGESTNISNTEDTFSSKIMIWTHDADHRFLNVSEGSATANGGVYFDNLSVKKQV